MWVDLRNPRQSMEANRLYRHDLEGVLGTARLAAGITLERFAEANAIRCLPTKSCTCESLAEMVRWWQSDDLDGDLVGIRPLAVALLTMPIGSVECERVFSCTQASLARMPACASPS